MAKLNQVLAVESGIKSATESDITEVYHLAQKPALFDGLHKTYKPIKDDGEKLPDEKKQVQAIASDLLKRYTRADSELMQVTARKDWTNCTAKADVKVKGEVILKDVPVTYLLFLEKRLANIKLTVTTLPVQDGAETWEKDENSGLSKSEPVPTHRTKKEQKAIVLYDATDKHPAQTQLITTDELVGHYYTTKMTGAMSRTEKIALLERIETLSKAVKEAREEANMTEEVTTPDIGEAVYNFLKGA